MIRADVGGITQSSPRKRFTPDEAAPKPERETPVIYGIEPQYQQIASLRVVAGRFFDKAKACAARLFAFLVRRPRRSIWIGGSRRSVRQSEYTMVSRDRNCRSATHDADACLWFADSGFQ